MPAPPVPDESGVSASRIVPFDSKQHAGLGISADARARFARSRNAFGISLAEFFYAARHYPVVFVKSAQGSYHVSAITGLRDAENLFVDDSGNWLESAYVPASVRRYPFYTAPADQNQPDRSLILVDETGLEPSVQPFFEASGSPGEKWPQMQGFLADDSAAEKLTASFTAKLERLQLLEAFEAQINPQQVDKMHLTGMYRINENRLNQLPAKTIRDLMKQGELSRIYAHLISLENFAKLLDLCADRDQTGVDKH